MTQETIRYTTQDIKETPMSMEAYIKEIRLVQGKDIFISKNGQLKTDDPEKEYIQLLISNDILNFENKENIVRYPVGNVPDGSKLAKFIKRYGKLETGMKIMLAKNIEGYYDLVI